jgi:hypothetical protein
MDRLADMVPGEERDVGGGLYLLMHRMQATEPLGDGWHLARSTEGGFSVELPLPFNDFRMRLPTVDGVEGRSHNLGGKTPGGLSWTAFCFARRDGQLGPGKPSPAPERMELKSTPYQAHLRQVEFDDMRCGLIVEAQGSDPMPPEADRLRFLRSLKRTGKPAW